MNISWESKRGSSHSNNDYVAIGVSGGNFTAVIVDASDKGKAPRDMAEYWAKTLLVRYLRQEHKSVVMLMKEAHKTLTPDYLTESASYTLIDVDIKNRIGNIVYVGDCRLGVNNQCHTNWINEPHIMVNTFPGLDNSYASILTRVLKARRFTQPDQVKFTWKDGDMLLLCTDGYWRPQSDDRGLNFDDVSVLKVRVEGSGFKVTIDSDCDNFFMTK
ncbi:hypothetical protein [Pantoea vagans]|uniref:hypothetical protein n=1 Tax=Pantoea vagans TaxID=470934 RepID=UPI0023B1483A|nr:hypothetical protein [Pantoea vagans]MDE8558456.1 hypothetical protein [Pantoea vagans]MDE8578460.1 hypothetical protein [Pantoea vagans]